MTHLVVSKPLRPLAYGNTTRLQYRVILDSGKELRLTEVARQIKVPYPSLAARIHTELATVGIHTDAFLRIIADVKKRKRAATKYNECPTCYGTGRLQRVVVPDIPTGDALAIEEIEAAHLAGDKALAQKIFDAAVSRTK